MVMNAPKKSPAVAPRDGTSPAASGLLVGRCFAHDLHVPGQREHLDRAPPEQLVVVADRDSNLLAGGRQANPSAGGVRVLVVPTL